MNGNIFRKKIRPFFSTTEYVLSLKMIILFLLIPLFLISLITSYIFSNKNMLVSIYLGIFLGVFLGFSEIIYINRTLLIYKFLPKNSIYEKSRFFVGIFLLIVAEFLVLSLLFIIIVFIVWLCIAISYAIIKERKTGYKIEWR